MLGKNALAGGGKCTAANVAGLIVIDVRVRSRCIRAYKLTAECARVRAAICKGVTNVIKLSAAVSACIGAGEQTDVTAIRVSGTANVAALGACIVIGVIKAGRYAANLADAAAFGRSSMSCKCSSVFFANVADRIAITVVGVSHGLALNGKSLAAVLANRAANGLGSVIDSIALADNSVAGGAAFSLAGQIASRRIGVNANGLAATLNHTDAVAVSGCVVVADVLTNGVADVADEVFVVIGVCNRLGSAASSTALCIAGTVPNVLLRSLKSATVIADLVASSGVKVLVCGSYVTADKTSGAASELKGVHTVGKKSFAAAVNAGIGACKCIFVRCLTGSVTVGAVRGALVKPCVSQLAFVARRTANITVGVAAVGVCMNNSFVSGLAANGASSGANRIVGVRQLGTRCFTNIAVRIATVRIGMLDRIKRRAANLTNLAVAGFALVLTLDLSFSRNGATVAERITSAGICVIRNSEACRQREERQGNSQK